MLFEIEAGRDSLKIGVSIAFRVYVRQKSCAPIVRLGSRAEIIHASPASFYVVNIFPDQHLNPHEIWGVLV